MKLPDFTTDPTILNLHKQMGIVPKEDATMADNSKEMFEVTFIDNGKTFEWSREECEAYFGKYEWREYEQGYAPHVVVAKLN